MCLEEFIIGDILWVMGNVLGKLTEVLIYNLRF